MVVGLPWRLDMPPIYRLVLLLPVFMLTMPVRGDAPLSGAATAPAQSQPAVTIDPRLKPYLDKDGGYKDHFGGYFNPTAGTYTDEKGGVLDNWGGYTYKDGSYKSKTGDYWDAATNTFKLADGEVVKLPATNEQAIKVLRETVEENGAYDKNYILKAMIAAIEKEHPAATQPGK